MAGLVSHIQVAGGHDPIYEAFYQQVDPAGTGRVGALDAAKFLKKSGLSDAILSKIWDLADPNGLGFLDKQSFFVALKLVSLAQNNKDILVSNLTLDLPPPIMGESSDLLSTAREIIWTMKPTERAKYDKLFDSLGPIQGSLPSSKVKPVMMNSKLPVDVLGRVWDLSDIDRDGSLDREEFALAMHLIYKALDNHPVPAVLPQDLIPQTKVKKLPPGAVPVLPPIPIVDGPLVKQLPSPPILSTASIDFSDQNIQSKPKVKWIITPAEQIKYDSMFEAADLDHDGFVNGGEIKDSFLQSGLPQPVLAHIWNLCDVKQNGRLNNEQFALAMYLVQQRVQGQNLNWKELH
ncbi:Epidermal growth factor receptor substrate 15-like 1 [Chamberlinius hualienensis]